MSKNNVLAIIQAGHSVLSIWSIHFHPKSLALRL